MILLNSLADAFGAVSVAFIGFLAVLGFVGVVALIIDSKDKDR